MKKVVSLALALVLMLAASIPVFAAPSPTGTYTYVVVVIPTTGAAVTMSSLQTLMRTVTRMFTLLQSQSPVILLTIG